MATATAWTWKDADKETVDTCPICGSANTNVFLTTSYKYEAHNVYPQVNAKQCLNCLFRFLGVRLSKAGYADFYSGVYRMFVGEVPIDDMARGQADYAKICTPILKGLEFKSLVDLGGSTGAFAAQLSYQSRCESVLVVDPCQNELDYCKQNYNLQTVCETAEDFEFFQTVDLTCLMRTVDHLRDPMAVLKKIRQHSQYLLIDFVDFHGACLRMGERRAVKLDHPCYFTQETAQLALMKSGWKPIRSMWLPTKDGKPFYLLMLCQ